MKGKTVNIYRINFQNVCPNNGKTINYHLTITTTATVMVERIIEACAAREPAYHEDLADELHETIGGKQTLVAYHHGVWIETQRGFE